MVWADRWSTPLCETLAALERRLFMGAGSWEKDNLHHVGADWHFDRGVLSSHSEEADSEEEEEHEAYPHRG